MPADINSMEISDFIRLGFDQRASDIFIKPGSPPSMRVAGRIRKMDEYPSLTEADSRRLCYNILSHEQISRFEHHPELDVAFTVEPIARVRSNIYLERQQVAGVFRIIPIEKLSLEELGMPPVLAELCKTRQGMILVTGPTGCGKSTTLAAMVDVINKSRQCHIVTIEDPIEFVHQDYDSIVSQREVGIDTESFQVALRAVVRESPDVILIGEMRDPETMVVALQAGETGHLVFSTVHTPSAGETLDRIINMFPPHEKDFLAMRLATSLRAIIAQKLVPTVDGNSRVAAVEIMICTPTISKLIEDTHFGEIYHAISEGNFWGMQTMNQCLVKYVQEGVVTEEMALNYAGILTELRQMLRRA
jgi:twitching motility protein PilT